MATTQEKNPITITVEYPSFASAYGGVINEHSQEVVLPDHYAGLSGAQLAELCCAVVGVRTLKGSRLAWAMGRDNGDRYPLPDLDMTPEARDAAMTACIVEIERKIDELAWDNPGWSRRARLRKLAHKAHCHWFPRD